MNIWIMSYFTDGSIYEHEAARLKASLEEFDICKYVVHRAPACDTWGEAVRYKPAFIQEMLALFRHCDGVLYVDTDAAFLREPDFSVFEDCHFAAHHFKRSPHAQEEILTGTLYFANTPTVKEMIDDWIVETVRWKHSMTPEQDSLREILPRWQDQIIAKRLDPEWCWIYDDFPAVYGQRMPIIEHYQASRKVRNKHG